MFADKSFMQTAGDHGNLSATTVIARIAIVLHLPSRPEYTSDTDFDFLLLARKQAGAVSTRLNFSFNRLKKSWNE